jgi:hypothetical protein
MGNIALTALWLIACAYPAGQAQMRWLTPMTADELDLPWAQTMATGLQPQTSSNAVTYGELFALLSWARDHQVLIREEARLLGTYHLRPVLGRRAAAAGGTVGRPTRFADPADEPAPVQGVAGGAGPQAYPHGAGSVSRHRPSPSSLQHHGPTVTVTGRRNIVGPTA